MENAALIILFALVQYVTFTLRVGAGRQKFGVAAPKTMGNESWERLYRVQQNTMEQLVVLIPAAIAFSAYVSDRWVLLPGLVYLAGRQLYSWEYVRDPKSRVPGISLTLFANAVLVIGALVGLLVKIF